MQSKMKALPIAVLVVALAVIAGLIGVPSASAAGEPDAKLLRTYQPVLIFHPNEQFRPTKVQSYIEGAQLERFVGTNTAQLPLDAYWTVIDEDPDAGSLPPSTPGV